MATADTASGTQYIFVLGTGRCGSTLVEEILCRHPSVGFVSNLEDLTAAARALSRIAPEAYRRLPPRVTQKGRLRFAPSEAYRALDREVSPVISSPFRDLDARDATPWLAHRFRRFFEQRAMQQRSPVFLHKFTGWPRAGYISRVFENARFIHVVRDGRAVANSWLQMPWWLGYGGPERWQWGPLPQDLARQWEESHRSFVVLAGLLWRMLVEAHDRARDALPDGRWLDVRYEDVTADPHSAFEELLEFCGLAWNAEFERALGRYTFDSSRRQAFLNDLGPDDVAALDRVLQDALGAHGYAAAAQRTQ